MPSLWGLGLAGLMQELDAVLAGRQAAEPVGYRLPVCPVLRRSLPRFREWKDCVIIPPMGTSWATISSPLIS
jgi:hypothetical protein